MLSDYNIYTANVSHIIFITSPFLLYNIQKMVYFIEIAKFHERWGFGRSPLFPKAYALGNVRIILRFHFLFIDFTHCHHIITQFITNHQLSPNKLTIPLFLNHLCVYSSLYWLFSGHLSHNLPHFLYIFHYLRNIFKKC